MPSQCAFVGCTRNGSLQAQLPGATAWTYYCNREHMDAAGAVWTERNKAQRGSAGQATPLAKSGKRKPGPASSELVSAEAGSIPISPHAERNSARVGSALNQATGGGEGARALKPSTSSRTKAARVGSPTDLAIDSEIDARAGQEQGIVRGRELTGGTPGGEGSHMGMRKRSTTVDYSILNGKWGAIVTSRASKQSEGPELSRGEGKSAREGEGGRGKQKEVASDGRKRKRNKTREKQVGDDAGVSSGRAAMALRRRVQAKLSRARYFENMLDAYQQEGWGGRGHRQLKPTAELDKCAAQLARLKGEIRSLLQALDPDAQSSAIAAHETRIPETAYSVDGVDVDQVLCAVCGSGESHDDNDILMCDFKNCNRAFHVKCHDPPLPAPPHEDEDWFCAHCFCYADSVEAVNECFGTSHSSWRAMFPELQVLENAGTPQTGEELEEDYISAEDDDYMPNPEAEIASDDERSVHTESAEDASSSENGEVDEEEESEDDGGQPGAERGVQSAKSAGGGTGLLARLMAQPSPPPSPRGRKSTKKNKGASPGGTSSTPAGVVGGKSVSKLAAFYAAWDPEFGYLEEDSDDDEYDPEASSDEGEPGSPRKTCGVEGGCSSKGCADGDCDAVDGVEVGQTTCATHAAQTGRSRRASAGKALQYFASLAE